MSLFQLGSFVGASGLALPWKIECDTLTDDDWAWAAKYVQERLMFGEVEGVPTGGLKFAAALDKYKTLGCGLLIVDDVLTTGHSINKYRGNRQANGFVLFARNVSPVLRLAPWVNVIWKAGDW